jgi:hypothetical protein
LFEQKLISKKYNLKDYFLETQKAPNSKETIEIERNKSLKECFVDCNINLTHLVKTLHKEGSSITKMSQYTTKIIDVFKSYTDLQIAYNELLLIRDLFSDEKLANLSRIGIPV